MINSIFRRHLKFILVGVLLGLLASAVVSYLNYAEKETAQVIDSQGGTIESQETLSEPVPEDVVSTTTPGTESVSVATTTELAPEVATTTIQETATTTEMSVSTSTETVATSSEVVANSEESAEPVSVSGGGGSASSEPKEVAVVTVETGTSTTEEFVATSTPETSTSTEPVATSTDEVIVQATTTPEIEEVAVEVMSDYPTTPEECRLPFWRHLFVNIGECMRAVR